MQSIFPHNGWNNGVMIEILLILCQDILLQEKDYQINCIGQFCNKEILELQVT